MKRHLLAGMFAATLLGTPLLAKQDPRPAVVNSEAKVQMAILLDTSNSMDGLIDQAKAQLWKIVNELSKAEVNGRTPRLEVALYEYGNDGLSATHNYVRQVLPFTVDLDRVSEELFRLKTNGGEEYCGAVIDDSLKHLEWSHRDKDMLAIFIAGNEPFTQGQVSYKEACASARSKGIVVNTIFCGRRDEGVKTQWEDGADTAGGRYLCIDQDRKVAEIPTPYDAELARLGGNLNGTYVAYGPSGHAAQGRQEAADKASAGISAGNMAARAQTKAGASYNNEDWDLVDAKKNGRSKEVLAKTPAPSLPPEMRGMDEKAKDAYLEKKVKERDELQKKIQELSRKRDEYIASHQTTEAGADTLDTAVLKTIRDQATAKGYKFKK